MGLFFYLVGSSIIIIQISFFKVKKSWSYDYNIEYMSIGVTALIIAMLLKAIVWFKEYIVIKDTNTTPFF